MNKYGLNIIWSDEDQAYIATCPEFPGLSAFGETIEDAIAEAKLAQELFVETYEQEKLPLPEPQLLQAYSGQFRLRIPQSLHFQLARMAEQEGVSLNQFIVMILASRAGGEEAMSRFESLVESMEKRLVKRTLTNNVELAVALVKALDVSPYQPIYRADSASNAPSDVPQFVFPTKEHSVKVM
ncbi:MAG: type II toxin-antitoxin system HicB family antitoxin [Acidobacteriota bacterium]|nr:type II toxin-antitoxin system HicB family antitoxin [Acidobacteriota bacterium]